MLRQRNARRREAQRAPALEIFHPVEPVRSVDPRTLEPSPQEDSNSCITCSLWCLLRHSWPCQSLTEHCASLPDLILQPAVPCCRLSCGLPAWPCLPPDWLRRKSCRKCCP